MPKCANCSAENAKYAYASAAITKKLVMKKAGTNYQHQSDLYHWVEAGGEHTFVNLNCSSFISPHAVAAFGDAHLYWLAAPMAVDLCSRNCAILYARSKSRFLARKSDASVVFPEQESFDAYARNNKLEHSLAQISADEAKDPVSELEALLKTKPPNLERIGRLAVIAATRGMRGVAIRSVDTLLANHPLHTCYGICSAVLQRLNEANRIDELHEAMVQKDGGRLRDVPEFLSTWAILIISGKPDKALTLSRRALERKPKHTLIVENHLEILRLCSPEEAHAFVTANEHLLKTDVGWFAAGRTYLDAGQTEKALGCFELAERHKQDPLNKMFAAEAQSRMGRFAESLDICHRALEQIESFAAAIPARGEDPTHYTHDQKKLLRKGLLAIQGKALVHLGEHDMGKKLIRDAIDIQVSREPNEPFFVDVLSLADGYLKRADLQSELEKQQTVANAADARAARAEVTSHRLAQLLSSLKSLEPSWSEALDEAMLSADEQFSNQQFAELLATLSSSIRDQDRLGYRTHYAAASQQFKYLPENVLQAFSTATFLLEGHKAGDLPIFAPVILELAKASETAVNFTVAEPFCSWLKRTQVTNGRLICIEIGTGRQALEIAREGQVRSLSLGELSLLCRSLDPLWSKYVRQRGGTYADWLTNRLPDVIGKIRGKRNGLAHYSSAHRTQAVEVQELILKSRLFETLDRLAEALRLPKRDAGLL